MNKNEEKNHLLKFCSLHKNFVEEKDFTALIKFFWLEMWQI
jgi:hypothetical protein